jgi:hypothetical protein
MVLAIFHAGTLSAGPLVLTTGSESLFQWTHGAGGV